MQLAISSEPGDSSQSSSLGLARISHTQSAARPQSSALTGRVGGVLPAIGMPVGGGFPVGPQELRPFGCEVGSQFHHGHAASPVATHAPLRTGQAALESSSGNPLAGTSRRPRRTGRGALHHPAPSWSHPPGLGVEFRPFGCEVGSQFHHGHAASPVATHAPLRTGQAALESSSGNPLAGTSRRPRRTGRGALHHPAPSWSHPPGLGVEVMHDPDARAQCRQDLIEPFPGHRSALTAAVEPFEEDPAGIVDIVL